MDMFRIISHGATPPPSDPGSISSGDSDRSYSPSVEHTSRGRLRILASGDSGFSGVDSLFGDTTLSVERSGACFPVPRIRERMGLRESFRCIRFKPFGISFILVVKKEPNQALEPTTPAVTTCADAQLAPAVVVAHL